MSNSKTYQFSYNFKNKVYSYSIQINFDVFKAGADALYFINKPNSCIAQISIEDFSILLKPVGSCILIDEQQGKTYNNFLPEYIYDLLDINAEYNLNKLDISVVERNHFEYILYKKENTFLKEYSLDFHKHIVALDSSLDSFIEELKSIAIFFIQEDFVNLYDESEDEYFLPSYAIDDFENFTESLNTEIAYSNSSF